MGRKGTEGTAEVTSKKKSSSSSSSSGSSSSGSSSEALNKVTIAGTENGKLAANATEAKTGAKVILTPSAALP